MSPPHHHATISPYSLIIIPSDHRIISPHHLMMITTSQHRLLVISSSCPHLFRSSLRRTNIASTYRPLSSYHHGAPSSYNSILLSLSHHITVASHHRKIVKSHRHIFTPPEHETILSHVHHFIALAHIAISGKLKFSSPRYGAMPDLACCAIVGARPVRLRKLRGIKPCIRRAWLPAVGDEQALSAMGRHSRDSSRGVENQWSCPLVQRHVQQEIDKCHFSRVQKIQRTKQRNKILDNTITG